MDLKNRGVRLGALALLTSIPLGFTLYAKPLIADESVESYLELELEDLLSLEVTSVSKKSQPINEAPAAIYVITQDDIRRSGVTSIPEALRMAPGLHVAQLDSNKWAISSRGFNGQFSNKLLVLIDGRSIYTPSFSGVYWDIQDTMIEDIDRIEVIRGPGATLWGSNAVNGVINIITKHSSQTQGGLAVVGAGNEQKRFSRVRYGAKLAEAIHGRAYLKYDDRDSSYAPEMGSSAGDEWDSLHAGFRVDGASNEGDEWMLQGGIYKIDEEQIVKNLFVDPSNPANSPPYQVTNLEDSVDASGWNLLGRWERRWSDQSVTSLQLYYDHNQRDEAIIGQVYDTWISTFNIS